MGLGQGQVGREASLGSVRACHAPGQLGSERWSPGGSCHAGEETVIFDRRQRQNDGTKLRTVRWPFVGRDWQDGVREANSRVAECEKLPPVD